MLCPKPLIRFSNASRQPSPQPAINQCFRDEVGRAEAELKDLNQKLLAAVANDPQAVGKITAAEKAWVSYRDSYIEAMWPADDKQLEYGTIYIANALGLRATLTRQHIEDVKELLKEHSGGNAH